MSDARNWDREARNARARRNGTEIDEGFVLTERQRDQIADRRAKDQKKAARTVDKLRSRLGDEAMVQAIDVKRQLEMVLRLYAQLSSEDKRDQKIGGFLRLLAKKLREERQIQEAVKASQRHRRQC